MFNFNNIINKYLGVSSNGNEQNLLLFDESTAAQDIAFMLGGQWDGCNGVFVNKCDEVAVNTAASLIGAKWCYKGTTSALLIGLPAERLMTCYAAGERNFINANLRCALLAERSLSKANLSWAKLNCANLSKIDLSGSDLTAADLSEANLSQANLSEANLFRTNLTGVNLTKADLRGANLSLSDLRGTNLRGANLRGAKLNQANLSKAIVSDETICE